jgi:hypothetical protein
MLDFRLVKFLNWQCKVLKSHLLSSMKIMIVIGYYIPPKRICPMSDSRYMCVDVIAEV